MKKSFKDFSFIQTFLFTTIIFLIIVILIEFLYSLTNLTFSEALEGLKNEKFLIRKGIAALVYGLIMTLYFKRHSLKK